MKFLKRVSDSMCGRTTHYVGNGVGNTTLHGGSVTAPPQPISLGQNKKKKKKKEILGKLWGGRDKYQGSVTQGRLTSLVVNPPPYNQEVAGSILPVRVLFNEIGYPVWEKERVSNPDGSAVTAVWRERDAGACTPCQK